MAGVTAVADAATSYSYAPAASAYMPAEVSVAAATSTASAPASTVVVTTNKLATMVVTTNLVIRIACVIGSNTMFAPSGTNASSEFTADTGEVS